MANEKILAAAIAAAIGIGGAVTTGIAQADGMFSFMNPFEWFDDDDDWDRWRYRYGPYGWGGPWGGPYAWGGPYNYGYPGQHANRTVIVLPSETDKRTAAVYPE
jgi:hypothetical protein